MRICLSNSPECAGFTPCPACYEALKGHVLVQAMVLAGGPFTERDSPWPERFLNAHGQVWRTAIEQTMAMALIAQKASIEEERAAKLTEPSEEPEMGYKISPEKMNEYMSSMKEQGQKEIATEEEENENAQEEQHG